MSNYQAMEYGTVLPTIFTDCVLCVANNDGNYYIDYQYQHDAQMIFTIEVRNTAANGLFFTNG